MLRRLGPHGGNFRNDRIETRLVCIWQCNKRRKKNYTHIPEGVAGGGQSIQPLHWNIEHILTSCPTHFVMLFSQTFPNVCLLAICIRNDFWFCFHWTTNKNVNCIHLKTTHTHTHTNITFDSKCEANDIGHTEQDREQTSAARQKLIETNHPKLWFWWVCFVCIPSKIIVDFFLTIIFHIQIAHISK